MAYGPNANAMHSTAYRVRASATSAPAAASTPTSDRRAGPTPTAARRSPTGQTAACVESASSTAFRSRRSLHPPAIQAPRDSRPGLPRARPEEWPRRVHRLPAPGAVSTPSTTGPGVADARAPARTAAASDTPSAHARRRRGRPRQRQSPAPACSSCRRGTGPAPRAPRRALACRSSDAIPQSRTEATPPGAPWPRSGRRDPSRREDRVGGQQRDRAAKRGPDRERQAFESNAVERRGHDPQEPLRSPAERDVDRRSRRVRLMTGDVEVSQPEREVDRIDVFERGCEIREVEREIENGDRDDRPRNGRLRRHGGEHLRSGCPSDNPADR